MVNSKGQTLTEYILMLACMTVIGLMIMKAMVGNVKGTGGAINKMTNNAAKKIADLKN